MPAENRNMKRRKEVLEPIELVVDESLQWTHVQHAHPANVLLFPFFSNSTCDWEKRRLRFSTCRGRRNHDISIPIQNWNSRALLNAP
jgi:hypothetical protein